MAEDERDRRDEREPQGRSERQHNKLADVLAVAEEHEPDAEKSKYRHGVGDGPKSELRNAATRGKTARSAGLA